MTKIWQHLTRFCSTRFTLLMVFLILLFVFRPHDVGITYTTVWQLLFSFVVFMGIFNARHHASVKLVTLILGVPSVVMSWIAVMYERPFMIQAYLVLTSLFIFVVVSSIIVRVILNARVTLETLRGVIVVYFLIAFGFAFAFYFIEIASPGSFHLIYSDESYFSHNRYLSEMMYFSFVTLLTVGYGDMTPKTEWAETLSVLEGIIGKFYMAILVARLVSVYTLLAHKGEEIPNTLEDEER